MNSLDVLSSEEVAGLFLCLHEFIVMQCGDGGLSRLHHWGRGGWESSIDCHSVILLLNRCFVVPRCFGLGNICSCQNKHHLDPKLKNLSPNECWQSYLSAFMMPGVVFWKGYEAQRALSEPLPLASLTITFPRQTEALTPCTVDLFPSSIYLYVQIQMMYSPSFRKIKVYSFTK